MPRMTLRRHETELDRASLRESVGTLQEGHRCADCNRAPLIGETLHVYADASTVCELCRPLRRQAPALSELVHNSRYGDTIHVRRIAPR